MLLVKSIRWRFQLWLAFLLILLLSGFGVSAYQLHRNHRLSQIDEELERRVSALNSDLRIRPPFGDPSGRPRPGGPGWPMSRRPSPDFQSDHPEGRTGVRPEHRLDPREIQLSNRALSLFDETDTNGFYYVIWSREGAELKRSTNAPASVPPPDRYNAGTRIHDRMNHPHREAFQLTEFGDCVLAGRQIVTDLRALRQFAGWLIIAGIAVLGLGLGGGWTLANRALDPVRAISSAASRISAGNLAERINIDDTDTELGRLATVLNSTFARLEAAFDQQRQFIADASHELRTPLTVMISEAQTTLARERTAAEYRDSVRACLDTAQSMRKLAQSLLELARLDAGQERLERSSFDLAERARACIDWIVPMAEARQIHIVNDLQHLEVFGDPDRLSQVVVNLLTNAADYSHPGGQIRISTHPESDAAVLTVANTGPGIAAADLPHIFKRFYRADKSRTGADGHSGLGLAICKAIIDAHNGSIIATSAPNLETTFTVRLPRAFDENVQRPAAITTAQP